MYRPILNLVHNFVRSSTILISVISCLVLSACSGEDEQSVMPATDGVSAGMEAHHLINKNGDTIPTGIRVPLVPQAIDSRQLSEPQIIALESDLITVPTSPRRTIRSDVGTITIPNLPLKSIANGAVPADTLPAEGEVSPVIYPPPTRALPTRIKNNATVDVQFLDVDQGLLSSYIRSALEDSKGYLWIGTSYGLSRYDGNHFLHFRAQEGLNNITILDIVEDRNGNLWLGTDNGLTRYDGWNFTHYLNSKELTTLSFRAILEDRQGRLWLAAPTGLYRYETNEKGAYFIHYTTQQGLPDNNVLSLLEDRYGNIWAGTSGGGLCRIETKQGETQFYHLSTQHGLPNDVVSSILEDRSGDIWLTTNGGLCRFSPNGSTGGGVIRNFTTDDGLSDEKIWHIIEDHLGQLWLGSAGGLTLFDGNQFQHYTTKQGLSSNVVRFLLEDSKKHIWLGTGGGGMNRVNPNGFKHLMLNHFIPENEVTAMDQDASGNLWFGTNDGFYQYTDSSLYYFGHQAKLPDNEIRSLLADRRGNIWLGTKAGVSRYEPRRQRFVHYGPEQGLVHQNVKAIAEDKQGRIWLGTDHGLSCFNNDQFTNYAMESGLTSEDIHSLLIDRAGQLWIGSKGGVSSITPDAQPSDTIIHYSTNEGLAGNDINALIEDRNGNIWAGSKGAGLSRFRNGQHPLKFTNYTTQDGLSDNTIWSLIEDRDGRIWIGTERGISVLVVNENEFYTFQKEEGLKRLDFQINSILSDQQSRLWWGSRGLVQLDLDRFTLPTEAPRKLELTHIEVNNEYVDYNQLANPGYREQLSFGEQLAASYDSVVAFANYPFSLKLPHKLNHLTFHFTAINARSQEKLRYRYRLKGSGEDWTYAPHTTRVTYRNLVPGDYTFTVQAAGESGKWSEPLQYSFLVRPPWHKTGWAYALYALLTLGLFYLIYYVGQNRTRLEHALEKRKAEAIHLKELDAVKTRLYTNLTHAFRTPLTIILGMTEQVQQKADSQLMPPLNQIQRSGQELLGLVNRLLDLSKLENHTLQLDLQQGDIVSFIHYITTAFHTYASGKDLSLDFNSEMGSLIMDYDAEQIQQVMSNLISNAIKFTPPGGQISISLSQIEDQLKIQVKDTGIGIDAEELPRIFDRFYQALSTADQRRPGTGIGLAHTREVVRLMEGRVTVDSSPGQGATFSVFLPIRKNVATRKLQSGSPLEHRPVLSHHAIDTAHGAAPALSPAAERDTGSEQPLLLVIEDHPEVASYLQTCLRDHYRLAFATDGQDGIDKAIQHTPDIIISDVMMPKKNGFEVCQVLKQDERTSHIPIILLTARADADSRLTGLETGADAYLAKPFNRRELLVRLENMLGNQQKIRAHFARKFANGFTHPAINEVPPSVNEIEDSFIERVRTIVEDNYKNEDFALPQLCREMSMSRSQLYRKMKALINTSPSDFIRSYRLEKARQLLSNEETTVSEAAWQSGFKDVAHFSKLFLEAFGYSPSQERS